MFIMETNAVKIKCPCCGAILAVKMQPGIENKKVTCPVCKESSSFKLFKKIAEKKEEHTEYPNQDEETNYKTKEETETGLGLNFTLGKLMIPIKGFPSFQLKIGKNIIGREASASEASCRLPMSDNRRMSREHLVIDVKKVPGKGFVHYASLYKQRVNDTFINNERLEYGDCIILNHGDLIKLPDITVKFEIPDEEGTEF